LSSSLSSPTATQSAAATVSSSSMVHVVRVASSVGTRTYPTYPPTEATDN
jgi:hypothetical protein